MSKRLSDSDKQARKNARTHHREMIRAIENMIQKLPAVEPKDWSYSNSMTMGDLASYLNYKFNVPITSAHGLVSLYVASRSDLVVTKGRRGGIHKIPVKENK